MTAGLGERDVIQCELAMVEKDAPLTITGRCYCGATRLQAKALPSAVAYCHCADCRRATGAPVAAFAAFDEGDVIFSPNEGREISVNAGVTRSFCEGCGSPLAGRFDYLPGMVYVALGLLDQADRSRPSSTPMPTPG